MDIQMARRLAQARIERGYSQEALAAELGVSRQAVSRWERADSSPDTDNLIALALLYGVSIDELLLGGHADAPADGKGGAAANGCDNLAVDVLEENPTVQVAAVRAGGRCEDGDDGRVEPDAWASGRAPSSGRLDGEAVYPRICRPRPVGRARWRGACVFAALLVAASLCVLVFYRGSEGEGWPVNELGQTYGSFSDVPYCPGPISAKEDYKRYPDLIESYATNGAIGYVRKEDLMTPPSMPAEESAKPMEGDAGYRVIPVYARDGHTQVGEFRVGWTG